MRPALLITVLALLGFPACGGSDEEAGGTGGETLRTVETQEETTTAETTTAETTTAAEPAGPVKVRITYKGGELSGDTGSADSQR